MTHPDEVTLVDRVAWATSDSDLGFHLTGCTAEERIMIARAEAILAMPEMQAIKTALLMSSIDVGLANDETKEDALRRRGLPESVVWWVLRRG